MDNQNHERWFQLCQLAAVEQDSAKLLALITEINQLLEAKETDTGKARQNHAWKQTAESDEHQVKARQPYRGREHHSESTANDSEKSHSGSDPSEDSE